MREAMRVAGPTSLTCTIDHVPHVGDLIVWSQEWAAPDSAFARVGVATR